LADVTSSFRTSRGEPRWIASVLAAYGSLNQIGELPPGSLGDLARIGRSIAGAESSSAWGSLSTFTKPSEQEEWGNETLDDDCETSGENNTSVILGIALEPQYLGMFTGDAEECETPARGEGAVR
jgi:hypothetical protein